MSKEWTLKELATETGVPERTIRFYISRGLVDPPLRAGRGAAYGEAHKARIEEIRKLQSQGLMLAEIAHALAPKLMPGGHARWVRSDDLADRKLESDASMLVASVAAEPGQALPEPEIWVAYPVADDVVVLLKGESGPWRKRRVLAALRAFAEMIEDGTKKENRDE